MSLDIMRAFRTGHMLNDQLTYQQFYLNQKPSALKRLKRADSPIQFYSEDWQNDL